MKRESVDRPPIALWRHFAGDDLRPESFCARVVEFQKRFDFDFVKVTPASGYAAEMYGAQLEDGRNREGTRMYVTRVVNDAADWGNIEALSSDNAVWQRELRSLELIRRELGDGVPILQTIFSPSYTARALVGDRFTSEAREHPEAIQSALSAISETTAAFALDCLAHGATAIFFATQLAARDHFTLDEYQIFGVPYDLTVLDAVKDNAEFVLLHVHGVNIHFDLFMDYPVQILNWHDRRTAPTLSEGNAKFRGAVAGGIDEWATLADGSPERIRDEIRDAVAQTDGRGLILSGGCVIPVDTLAANILAALEASATG